MDNKYTVFVPYCFKNTKTNAFIKFEVQNKNKFFISSGKNVKAIKKPFFAVINEKISFKQKYDEHIDEINRIVK